MRTLSRWLLAASVTLSSMGAYAADVTIKAVGVKYDPAIVEVGTGDQISWTNMASHNVETLQGLVPEGTKKINTKVGDDVSLKFDKPGIYVYKCTPHWGSRMGGILIVGQPEDAMKTAEAYLEKIEKEKGDLLPAKGLVKDLIEHLKGSS